MRRAEVYCMSGYDEVEHVGANQSQENRAAGEHVAEPGLVQVLADVRARRQEDPQLSSHVATRPAVSSGLPRERISLRSSGGLGGHFFPPALPSDGPARMLVAVHGVTRNRQELTRELLHHVPEQFAVLMPYFSQKRFRGYQRLEPGPKGARPDLELLRLLGEVERVAAVKHRASLFGFSGGAQFAHRFAMVYPERVECLVAVAAGFYTFPDEARAFPYGVMPSAALEQPISEANWRLYLECPKHVLVGELDTARDRQLRQKDDLDRIQGRERTERARRFAFAMRAHEIRSHGRPQTRFSLLRDSGHSLRECVARGGLGAKLASILMEVGESANEQARVR